MAKKKSLKQIYLAWMLQYEKVDRLKSNLKKAKRLQKILRTEMANRELKGEKVIF